MSKQPSRTPGKPSNSRITEIWRSLLSWMRWHLRARSRRRQQELDEQRERLLFALLTALPTQAQVEEIVHRQLMLAMQPLAQALERQDTLLELELNKLKQELVQQQMNNLDLLTEVLNSLQPPVEQQLLTYRPRLPTSPS